MNISISNYADKPKNTTITNWITSALEKSIIEGKLKLGTKIDEISLANEFDVSRTPVREALQNLAAAELIDLKPRHGAVVKKLQLSEIIELFELMAVLEATAAKFAVLRMSNEELQVIKVAHEKCRAAALENDIDLFYNLNFEFHRCVHAASRNRSLQKHAYSIDLRLKPYRRLITFRKGRVVNSIAEHDLIMNALSDRDEQLAYESMFNHLQILSTDAVLIASTLEESN